MNQKDIKKWYQQHGMEYIEEDWADDSLQPGDAGYQNPRSYRAKGTVADPIRLGLSKLMEHIEQEGGLLILWGERDDRELVEVLEEFFDPYIAMLNYPKGNVLRQFINDRFTYAEAAEEGSLSRWGAWKQVRSAMREVVKLIAQDDLYPSRWKAPDRRQRYYAAEKEAAWRVFARFMERRRNGRN
jgi:predicted DNA-binding protein YlxM (UPF0122 family)